MYAGTAPEFNINTVIHRKRSRLSVSGKNEKTQVYDNYTQRILSCLF